MLTPDLVRARRVDRRLVLSRWSNADRDRAHELAEELIGVARGQLGASREDLRTAWLEVEHRASEQKLVDGLKKLLEDQAEFSAEASTPPSELRRLIFSRASDARKEDPLGFSREDIVEAAASELGLSLEELEHGLYADLKQAHVLRRFAPQPTRDLLTAYEIAQVQAVLLRAVRVRLALTCRAPEAYRAFFRRLKFRRLLWSLFREGDGYRLEIDGPFSLFESVTTYGLRLALLVPILRECDRVELSADVRWGKRREELSFEWVHLGTGEVQTSEAVPDDVQAILEAFGARPAWTARLSDAVLDVRGAGVCVPDIEFRHVSSGRRVYLEVLGYWSRDAVWRRVELAERGLADPVLFAVSERLRVSQAVLDGCDSAALYVYKGVMSPAAIERHLEKLVGLAGSRG